MPKVTGSWERPIQGVSQQSDKDRLEGQCTEQVNFIPSPLYGLVKRTGTQHIAKLLTSTTKDALWYAYSRGDDESYVMLIEPYSRPRVFDVLGNERVVNTVSGSSSYYTSAIPADNLKFSTIADYTYILNTSVVVEEEDDLTPMNPDMAIIYCQYATYGRDYIITIDGLEVARYSTPDGSETEHIDFVKTDYVAEQLQSQLLSESIKEESVPNERVFSGGGGGGSSNEATLSEVPTYIYTVFNVSEGEYVDFQIVDGKVEVPNSQANDGDLLTVVYRYAATGDYTVERTSNTLFVTKTAGGSFLIDTSDSSDGNDLVAIQDQVQQLTNLPPYAPDGYVVKVQNQVGYDANSFWLRAERQDGDDDTEQTGSTVRWVETTAQNTKYKIKKSTMPHVLISEADGSFTLSLGEWEDRRVGNDDTNPFPSFVGSTINSVGTFQNRVVVTSGESAIFTRTNNFFDFFKETTQAESDSDPIDAYADTSSINNLSHSAVLDGDIVFFAENGQFLIDGSKPITASSLVFKQVTSYPMISSAAPAITGESVMFAYRSGSYVGIREMFTDSYTDTKRARPITEHVSEYIKGNVKSLVSSPNINTLFIQTDEDLSVVYVYDWLWAGDNKVQAAMHEWSFNGEVQLIKFIRDNVYFVIKRGSGVYLESMPYLSDSADSGLSFPLRLDQRSSTTATWSTDRWVFTLPYVEEDDDKLTLVRGEGCWEDDRGTSVVFERSGTSYWTFDDLGDTDDVCTLLVGTTVESSYIPTKPFIKDSNGRVIGLDRFTIGKITINYESIGNTNVTVSDQRSRRDWSYDYNGRMFGGWNNRVGFAPLDSGSFQIPIRLQSANAQIRLSTSDYRPCIIRDMEWEGLFKQRGRRL